MNYIERSIEKKILDSLKLNKVILVYGARRVGKTEMIKHLVGKYSEKYLWLNGDDMDHIAALEHRSRSNYQRLIGDAKLLVIDEAQQIPEIGLKLKLMIDTLDDLKIIATGSSAFDLNNQVGEPLVGRKREFYLYPIAQMELFNTEDYLETIANLNDRLVFGTYPELVGLNGEMQKIEYLKDQINSYLLKDILSFEGIKKRDKMVNLLKIISFRVGSEISMESIGRQLQISKNTVDRYLDLFSKVFIIYKVKGFSRNLDNEITKKSKWYFFDNGIRNAIISSFNPIELRNDIGKLWENYLISERIKYQSYNRLYIDNYFWRNKNRQEIDWVEDRDNKLYAYEFKWNPKVKVAMPSNWKKGYPDSNFVIVNRDNYLDFINP